MEPPDKATVNFPRAAIEVAEASATYRTAACERLAASGATTAFMAACMKSQSSSVHFLLQQKKLLVPDLSLFRQQGLVSYKFGNSRFIPAYFASFHPLNPCLEIGKGEENSK